MSVFYIYILVDPREPNEVRYVGRTKDPIKRISTHITPSKLLDNTYKNNWIKKLLRDEIIPKLICIEKCTNLQRETYWIRYYKSLGFDITNANDGGDGQLKPSQETINKIKKALTGRIVGDRLTNKGRTKISTTHKDKELTDEQKDKWSFKGKTHTDDSKNKLRTKRLNQKDPRIGKTHTDKTKKILSEKMSGNKHPQFGKTRSEETKQKIRETKLKAKNNGHKDA